MRLQSQCHQHSLPCGPFEEQSLKPFEAAEKTTPSQDNARLVPVLLLEEVKLAGVHGQRSTSHPEDLEEDGSFAPRQMVPWFCNEELPPRPQTEGSSRPEAHANVMRRVRPGTSLSSAHLRAKQSSLTTPRLVKAGPRLNHLPTETGRPGTANCNEETAAAVRRQHIWDLSPPVAPLLASSPKPPATMLPTRAVALGLFSASGPRQVRSVSMIGNGRLDPECHVKGTSPVRRRDVLKGSSLLELEVSPSTKQLGPLAQWEALTPLQRRSRATSLPRPQSMSAMALDFGVQRMPPCFKHDKR